LQFGVEHAAFSRSDVLFLFLCRNPKRDNVANEH
jgi:hypothetical protein